MEMKNSTYAAPQVEVIAVELEQVMLNASPGGAEEYIPEFGD